MKKYVLLFDGNCAACSKVARLVGDLAVADLGAMPLRDPEVTEVLRRAGLDATDRPSLLVTGDGGVRVVSGWSMRRHLAAVVGWRRSRAIMRLLAAEWRARMVRGIAEEGLPRRRVVGTALAGVAGLAFFPRSAAAARTAQPGPDYAPASAVDVKRALASGPVQRATRAWGPVKPQVMEITDGAERILVFTHGEGERHIITFVDNAADARPDAPLSISLGKTPLAGQGMRFYSVDGIALCDVTADHEGKVAVRPADGVTRAASNETVVPDFNVNCWFACMSGIPLLFSCAQACEFCFTLLSAVNCAYCGMCAGPRAFTCAKACP
jgi:predicted DCC family thiol-disulfide oxidoreductase YuxK